MLAHERPMTVRDDPEWLILIHFISMYKLSVCRTCSSYIGRFKPVRFSWQTSYSQVRWSWLWLDCSVACWLERLFECKIMVICTSMSTSVMYTIVIKPRAMLTLRDTENLGTSYRTNTLIMERVTTRRWLQSEGQLIFGERRVYSTYSFFLCRHIRCPLSIPAIQDDTTILL
jgi:hypothetical protein